MKNLHLKVLSIVIAVSLWLSLMSGEYQEFSVYTPVRLKNNMQGEFVAVTSDSHVNVVAKAPQGIIRNLEYNAVSIEVDVASLGFGDTYHRLSTSEIRLPSGLELVRIEPEGINITVDKLVKKSAKIVPTFIGDPHSGFLVGNVTVYPEFVEIQGAANKLSPISTIETKPVNLSGKREGITYSMGIKETDGVLSTTPEQVEVYVSFKENIETETVQDLPVSAANLADNLKATVKDKIDVTVKGRSDLLTHDLVNKKILFYVDMTNILETGTYTLKVKSGENSDYKVQKISPERVKVKVERKGD
jgi:hypothetical protein